MNLVGYHESTEEGLQQHPSSRNSSSATLHHWCAMGTAVFLNMTAGMHVSRSNHQALSAGEQ